MPRFVLSIAIALALVPVVAACGGDERDSTAVGAAKAHEAALDLDGRATQGSRVWTKAGCGACHTLSASRSTGTSAPNLDEVRPSATLVVDRVALGFKAMPTYQGLLTPQQIADVGAYVADATRK
ncbi:MAG TPA: c-type cytochrome [Gaiellaceae bacterium]|nr:c-type cytochrome [Gaiellaceae bacterium]